MDNRDPNKKDSLLKYKVSSFQPLKSKRPFENTDSYENRMRQNRLDPRIFSVYKIADEPKKPNNFILYVDDGYVDDGYIEVQINYI